MSNSLFLAATQALGVMAICTIAYSWAQRSIPHRTYRRVAIGCILGIGSTIAMHQPYLAVDGLQVDGRNMFLAIATAFGGALSAAIATVIACAVRIWIGGIGVVIGVATMLIVVAMSSVWAYQTKGSSKRSLASWIFLGGIVSLPLVVTMNILGISEPSVALVRVATDMIGAVVFGTMYEGELRRGRRERQLNREASTDPLTGLPNRRAMMEFLDNLTPSERRGMALLIIDADHFKSINDTFGHDVGDEVLKSLSSRLSASIRDGDFAARLGGEEFAVLLKVNKMGDGYALADRLRTALCLRHAVNGTMIDVTVSVGGTALPDAGTDFQKAYAQADAALYSAKRLGRDRAVFA